MLVEKELIVTGKTIDEAIEKGLQQLGMDRDNISVEVLATPTRGFLFGIGATDAKVRLAYEAEEADPPKAPKPVQPPKATEQPKPAQAPKPAQQQKPAQLPRTERAEPAERHGRTAKPEQPSGEKKPEAPRQVREPKPQSRPQEQNRQTLQSEQASSLSRVQGSDAERFLREVLGILEIEADIVAETDGDILRLSLSGDNMGLLIGRRGETMDALQYLTGLATNRNGEGYGKVSLDIEHYRAKREEALVSLANKVAGRVLKERRTVTLEAMNPYERRIIHATLQSVPGVQTGSVGHEPNRRVVVSLSDGGDGTDKNRRSKPRRRGGRGKQDAPAGQAAQRVSEATEGTGEIEAPERERAHSIPE